MRRRVKLALGFVVVTLVVCCGGVFAVIPWSPFGARAPSLDLLIPADVDLAVRFDAGTLEALRGSPVGRALGAFDLLDVSSGDDGAGAALALIGDDAALGLRDDDWLFLVRVSGPVHATGIEAARTLGPRSDGPSPRADLGVVSYAGPNGVLVHVLRIDDVFAVSVSVDLLVAAHACSTDAAASVGGRPDGQSAFGGAPRGDNRLRGWLASSIAVELLRTASSAAPGAEDVVSAALALDHIGPTAIVVDPVPADAVARLTARWTYSASARPLLGAPLTNEIDVLSRALGEAGGDVVLVTAAATIAPADLVERIAVPQWLSTAIVDRRSSLRAPVAVSLVRSLDAAAELTQVGVCPVTDEARLVEDLRKQRGVRAGTSEHSGAPVFSAGLPGGPTISFAEGRAVVRSSGMPRGERSRETVLTRRDEEASLFVAADLRAIADWLAGGSPGDERADVLRSLGGVRAALAIHEREAELRVIFR